MVFTNAQPFPFNINPISNVTPFTYADGITYLEKLELMRVWLNKNLVPEFNAGIDNAIAEFQAGIANAELTITNAKNGWQFDYNAFTLQVNTTIADFQASVNTALAESQTDLDARSTAFEATVNESIAGFEASVDATMTAAQVDIAAEKVEWQNSYNTFMANVTNEIAALNDSAFSGLIENPNSATGVSIADLVQSTLRAWGFEPPAIDAWVHWGDSMTAGATSWVTRFAALTGMSHYNGGVGGETSIQVRTRALANTTYRDRRFTIGVGRNNFTVNTTAEIISDIRAMLNHLTVAKQGFVLDVAPWVGEALPAAPGSAREKLETLNAQIELEFPELYFPVFSMLRTNEAATVTGITWTEQDTADIANGYTPQSFRSDSGHLNHIGQRAVYYFISKEAQTRGYTTVAPIAATALALTNADFESATLSPWGNNDGAFARTTAAGEFRSGVAGANMTFAPSTSSAISYPFGGYLTTLIPLKKYEISFQLKAPVGHVTRMLVHEYAGDVLVFTNQVISSAGTGTWGAVSGEITLRADTTKIRIQINKASASETSTAMITVDDLRIVQLN